MGHDQRLVVDYSLPEEQYVDIDFSGAFVNVATTPEPPLDTKAGLKQSVGRQIRLHLADHIEEVRLVQDVKRVGAIDRRAGYDVDALLNQGAERSLKLFLPVPKVRAEGQEDG